MLNARRLMNTRHIASKGYTHGISNPFDFRRISVHIGNEAIKRQQMRIDEDSFFLL